MAIKRTILVIFSSLLLSMHAYADEAKVNAQPQPQEEKTTLDKSQEWIKSQSEKSWEAIKKAGVWIKEKSIDAKNSAQETYEQWTKEPDATKDQKAPNDTETPVEEPPADQVEPLDR
ncbi:MAG: hypothetical protein ACE365_07395 [Gammaproteobacteria bacterium]